MDLAKIEETLTGSGDHREQVMFPNGRGVSIIRNPHSYGGRDGMFEVAVLDKDGDLDYSTPVTTDVMGYLTVSEVLGAMTAVAELPEEGSKEDKVLKLKSAREQLENDIAALERKLDNKRRDYGDLNRDISALEG